MLVFRTGILRSIGGWLLCRRHLGRAVSRMTADEQAQILAKMVSSDDVRLRDRGVIATWLAENTDVSDVLEAAEKLIKAQGDAGLWTFLASDVNGWDRKGSAKV